MPIYTYQCQQGHEYERFYSIKHHRSTETCLACYFHDGTIMLASQIITAPILVKVAPDICYDSPVDGRVISSWSAREEDLKRHHCRPYDPAMKQDAERFRNESQAKVEAAMDETVAEAITKMPTKERGKLYTDLTEKGLTADIIRTTV